MDINFRVVGQNGESLFTQTYTNLDAGAITAVDDDGFQVTASQTPTPTPTTVRAEAGQLSLSGFVSRNMAGVSGGAIAGLATPGGTGTASFTFGGQAGTYSLDIAAVAAVDGASSFEVRVNGETQGFVAVNELESQNFEAYQNHYGYQNAAAYYMQGGGTLYTANDIEIKTVADLELQQGDVVEIIANGYESGRARFDYIELTQQVEAAPAEITVNIEDLLDSYEQSGLVAQQTIDDLRTQLADTEATSAEQLATQAQLVTDLQDQLAAAQVTFDQQLAILSQERDTATADLAALQAESDATIADLQAQLANVADSAPGSDASEIANQVLSVIRSESGGFGLIRRDTDDAAELRAQLSDLRDQFSTLLDLTRVQLTSNISFGRGALSLFQNFSGAQDYFSQQSFASGRILSLLQTSITGNEGSNLQRQFN